MSCRRSRASVSRVAARTIPTTNGNRPDRQPGGPWPCLL